MIDHTIEGEDQSQPTGLRNRTTSVISLDSTTSKQRTTMFWAKESHEDGFIEDVSNRESIGVVDAAVLGELCNPPRTMSRIRDQRHGGSP